MNTKPQITTIGCSMQTIENLLHEKVKIDGINIYALELPMKKPFRISVGEITRKPLLILEILSDGSSGYGEVAALPEPIYSAEDVETAKRMLTLLTPKLMKNGNVCYEDILSVLSQYRGHNMAKAAIDYAFWYLLSKKLDFPLLSITNPSKTTFEVQESVPILPKEKVSEWIEDAYSRGIKSIKIKIQPGHSWEIVKFVKDTLNPDFISVDANGSFNPRNSNHLIELNKTAEYVDEIEQPFRPKNLYAHVKFLNDINSVVSLDESIENLDDAIEYAELSNSKGVINIKPPRVGGLYNSWIMANEMRNVGVDCFVGGLLETSLGREFNMAIAGMKNVSEKYTSDFSPPSDFYKDDITYTSFDIKDGHVKIPESRNVPFEVDKQKLAKYEKPLSAIA